MENEQFFTITRFILRSVSYKSFKAGVTFARHGYSRPAEAGQPTRQPPQLLINRGRHCKVTTMVNELLIMAGIVR